MLITKVKLLFPEQCSLLAIIINKGKTLEVTMWQMKQTPRIERRNKYILCSGLEWNSGFEAKNNVSIQWTVGQLNSCTFLEVTLLVFSRTVLRQSTSPFNKPLASLIAKYAKLIYFSLWSNCLVWCVPWGYKQKYVLCGFVFKQTVCAYECARWSFVSIYFSWSKYLYSIMFYYW